MVTIREIANHLCEVGLGNDPIAVYQRVRSIMTRYGIEADERVGRGASAGYYSLSAARLIAALVRWSDIGLRQTAITPELLGEIRCLVKQGMPENLIIALPEGCTLTLNMKGWCDLKEIGKREGV